MQSVMSHNFSEVPGSVIPRSSFNRSCGYKTTFDSGYLIPVFIDEALPGDTFALNMTSFARMTSALSVPVMDNLFCDSFFFAVPKRLLWTNWKKFNGEQVNPGDSTDYLVPQMESPASTGYAVGSLSDYFGIPTGIPELAHNSWWHRAYNLIWNEWFRDENLQDSVTVDTGDGPDDPTDYVLLKRGKRHDYFTSCLPWPQKGTAVTLPLGTSAPITRVASATNSWRAYNNGSEVIASNNAVNITSGLLTGAGATGITLDPRGGLIADLSTATAATINALRQAFQVQAMYEKDARSGTRYTEIIRAHFGVISPDARMHRPEYLGGGSTPIKVSPIAQTSASDETTPQGNLAGIGQFATGGQGFVKSFTEHCVIMGLISVRADLTYQQGLNRMFSRRTRFDYYWPGLAHLGEQSVLNKEIYAQGDANDELVFGYQERYAEYRYKPSQITGKLRSTASGSLDVWHLSQEFESLPTLNSTFIQEAPPISRITAVDSEPQFIFDAYYNLKCVRPMPTYSIPGAITRF